VRGPEKLQEFSKMLVEPYVPPQDWLEIEMYFRVNITFSLDGKIVHRQQLRRHCSLLSNSAPSTQPQKHCTLRLVKLETNTNFTRHSPIFDLGEMRSEKL
jgi:hypothetical protein